jgi:hypothetical protein
MTRRGVVSPYPAERTTDQPALAGEPESLFQENLAGPTTQGAIG